MKKVLTTALTTAVLLSGCSFTQNSATELEVDKDRIHEIVISQLTSSERELMDLSSKDVEVDFLFGSASTNNVVEEEILLKLKKGEYAYEAKVPGTASAEKDYLTIYISQDYEVLGEYQDESRTIYDAGNTAYNHMEEWQKELVPFFASGGPAAEVEKVNFKGIPAIKVTFDRTARKTHGNLIAYVSEDEKYLLYTEFDKNIQK